MLQYRLEGSGQPLLLVHGWGVSYTIWQDLAPLLTPHFQLIMVELPGVGGSEQADPEKPYYQACAEAIEEVRLALGIANWSLLAYSTGTRAAEAYIQRFSENVSRAVFLCPIYLTEFCSLGVRLLDETQPPEPLTHWLFSKWRLYGLVLALGFNGRRHDYVYTWRDEIELQDVDTLVRSLRELPGRGRAQFEPSTVPTLFMWGSRDALTARPRRPRPNDIVIPANHSAPMLAAHTVAEVATPFFKEGKLVSATPPPSRWKRRHYSYEAEPPLNGDRVQLLKMIRSATPRSILQRTRALMREK